MTFDEIVSRVCVRFNLTSDEAIARVEEEVNERYMEVISTVGLNTSAQSDAVSETEEGSRFVTFGEEDNGSVMKVETVKDRNVNETSPRILQELTAEEMMEESLTTWPPTKWAVYRVGPGFVTIQLNAEAEADDYELEADILEDTAELSGEDEPQFPRPFHDILVHGAMAIEADKKEKSTRQNRFEMKFEKRLSELRYFLATSMGRRMWSGRRPRRR